MPSGEREAILTDGSRVGAWRTSRVEGRNVLVALSVAVLVAIAVSGCTSGIKLRNPQTGETATCGPYHVAPNMGFTPQMAMERERQCLDDFYRQGFVRAPN